MPSVEWNNGWAGNFRHMLRERPGRLYGLHWGDLSLRGLRYRLAVAWAEARGRKPPVPLYNVVDAYVAPYLRPDMTVPEIGAGGGRYGESITRIPYSCSGNMTFALDARTPNPA